MVRQQHAVWTACDEHVEDAIDDTVHTYETSPDLYSIDACAPTGQFKTCDYCANASKYLIV